MAVYKTIYQQEEDGAIFIADTIEYEGKLWLVPEWLSGPTSGTERPARIICTDGLGLKKAGPTYDADFVLSAPLSTEILAGRALKQGLLVIEQPDIHLRVDTDFHR